MSFTERLMSTGDWNLRLRSEIPQNILGQMGLLKYGFGHIVIFPTHSKLDEIGSGFTDAQRLAHARYVGVYRSRDSEFEVSGPGLAFWLGDEEGKGDVFDTVTGGSGGGGTLTGWRVTLTPAGFTGATGLSTPGGTFIKTYDRVTRRDILADVCAFFGSEWKVTNDLKFWLGVTEDLFNVTPRAAIVRHSTDRGHEPHLLGVGAEFDIEQDLEDWTREVDYYTGTEDTPSLATATTGAGVNDIPYRNIDGTAILMNRIIEDFGETPTVNAAALAAAQLGRFNRVRQSISVASTGYEIGERVAVGDYVWLYDPTRDLMNLANEVPYRGGMIWPIKIRCTGMTSPIREGMGVYFRRWVDNNTATWDVEWVDLTEWVEWESSNTKVELGDLPRPMNFQSHMWHDKRDVQAQPRYINSIVL